MMTKIRMGVVGAAALGTAVFVIPAGGAQALSAAPHSKTVTVQSQQADAQATRCWNKRVTVRSAVLRYTECDRGRLRLVRGVVDDTRNNGRCARAKVRFVPSGATKVYKDCGGRPTYFNTGWKVAADARVTLTG
jgi:hypothetical protein